MVINMKEQEWSGILVYLEQSQGEISSVSIEILREAERIAKQLNENVSGIMIGNNIKEVAKDLDGYFIDQLFLYETEVQEASDECLENCLTACIKKWKPSILLFGGTRVGKTLAPRIAIGFATGVTADCTQFEIWEGKHLLQIRPAFGGNIMAKILTDKSRPQIATIRAGIYRAAEKTEKKNTVIFVEEMTECMQNQIQVLSKTPVTKTMDITKSKKLFVVGRGIKKQEDLDIFYRLAEKMGAQLACSRALVEKGWMPQSRQIGISGNTVEAEEMITFGVSGSIQFQTGIKKVKHIIAINTDPKAPIFQTAHVPICVDLYEILPYLVC